MVSYKGKGGDSGGHVVVKLREGIKIVKGQER